MTNGSDTSSRIARLRQYLQADPSNLALRQDLCDSLLDAGETADAREVLEPAVQQYPAHPGLLYRLGVIQRRQGQLAEAKSTLTQLLEAGTQADAVLYEAACVHLLLNEPAESAKLLTQLSHSAGYAQTYPDADFFLLRVLHQDSQVDEALTHGQQVLAAGTNDTRVLGAMATLYIDGGQISEAGKLLHNLASQMPEELPPSVATEVESAAGYVALNSEDLALARRHFQASLSSGSDFGRSLLGLGLVEAASGDLPKAMTLLQQTVQAMPTHIGSWHTLAWMQLLQDDLDGAEANFAHALEMDPTFGESQGGMALIAALRGDHARAKELCRVASRLDRNSMNVLATQMVLQYGSLKSPEILKTAMPMLAKRPGLNNSSLQESIVRMARRR